MKILGYDDTEHGLESLAVSMWSNDDDELVSDLEDDDIMLAVCALTSSFPHKQARRLVRTSQSSRSSKDGRHGTTPMGRLGHESANNHNHPPDHHAIPCRRDFSTKRKGNAQQEPKSRLQSWYLRTLGPSSWLRRTIPVAKNYIL